VGKKEKERKSSVCQRGKFRLITSILRVDLLFVFFRIQKMVVFLLSEQQEHFPLTSSELSVLIFNICLIWLLWCKEKWKKHLCS